MNQDSFTYTKFWLDDGRKVASFEYVAQHEGHDYTLLETLEFPVQLKDTPQQQRGLRTLHIALGVSYYKTFLQPVIVHPYAMDAAEAAFWNNAWRNGLGEFLYVNKLPAGRLAQFAAQDGQRFDGEASGVVAHGALLGVGGGKDSIVAGELLKDLQVPVTGFVMATGEALGQAGSVAQTMGIPLHAVKRQLDRTVSELGQEPGGYRGHVPISLIFGLVGATLAVATDAAYVVVGNEASASIPRITSGEQMVNHQWSKSLESEQALQAYIHTSITGGITYFSAVRQLTSIGVAKLFALLPRYFEIFTSDNSVFRVDPARRPNGRWSLESPKSLSSYLLLAPWLSDKDVHRIFTLDFLNEASLAKLFLEMTGIEGEPPLDCVGTVEELVLSANLLARAGRYHDSSLMQLARDSGVIHDGDWQQNLHALLQLQPDEALPEELREPITTHLQESVAA
jgi:hypothetical protein